LRVAGVRLSKPGWEPDPVKPVPVSETVCAPVERLMVSVPVRVPGKTGVKVMVTVQLLPAAREEEQVVVSAKSPVAVTPLFVTAVVPLLVTVTVWLALVAPTATVPKFRVPGATVTGELPVPVRLTFWGLFEAPSVNVNVPVAAPVAVGVKVTPTVQLAPAAILVPQVLLAIAKPAVVAGLVPAKLKATLWRFVSVTVPAALVAPTATVPKFKVLEETVTGALPVAVPLRLTVWGLFAASSMNVRVPVAAPVVVGENVTPTVQLAPGATLVPQVLLAIAKPALVVMLEKFRTTLS